MVSAPWQEGLLTGILSYDMYNEGMICYCQLIIEKENKL